VSFHAHTHTHTHTHTHVAHLYIHTTHKIHRSVLRALMFEEERQDSAAESDRQPG